MRDAARKWYKQALHDLEMADFVDELARGLNLPDELQSDSVPYEQYTREMGGVMRDRWVERFIKKALPKILSCVSPSRVIIFGSRVRCGAREDSDIDVIIVSDYFKDIPFVKRMPMLLRSSAG